MTRRPNRAETLPRAASGDHHPDAVEQGRALRSGRRVADLAGPLRPSFTTVTPPSSSTFAAPATRAASGIRSPTGTAGSFEIANGPEGRASPMRARALRCVLHGDQSVLHPCPAPEGAQGDVPDHPGGGAHRHVRARQRTPRPQAARGGPRHRPGAAARPAPEHSGGGARGDRGAWTTSRPTPSSGSSAAGTRDHGPFFRECLPKIVVRKVQAPMFSPAAGRIPPSQRAPPLQRAANEAGGLKQFGMGPRYHVTAGAGSRRRTRR